MNNNKKPFEQTFRGLFCAESSAGLFILILNQPIDKSSAEISPFFVKLPCRAASPPAVAFLD